MKRILPVLFFLSFNYYIAYTQGSGHGGTSILSVSIAFNTTTSTPYLKPQYVSGVINDPTDPAATIGFAVNVKENGTDINAVDYTLTATSSKTSVVTVSNVIITKFNGYANVKIIPTGVGYSDIKLTLTKSSSTANATIKYAASAASATPIATYFHTGISDASAAFPLDDDYMVVGDDEINSLYIFNRKQSGLAVKTYDYQNLLSLTDGSSGNYKEIDLEAAVRSISFPNRIYWMSSLGDGNTNPNINRLFATTVTGTGASTNFAMAGHYDSIRQKLIAWGNSKGYNFTASGANGKDPKSIDGLNVEGMCMGPDNTTLYIAFRAPYVPVSNRSKALIAPIQNFESWFNNGSPTGSPTIGNPIELNLGSRGFRDIIRLSNGLYIIIGGNYAASPLTGALFKWTGNATDAPVQITNMDISTLNAESLVEIHEAGGTLANNRLQIISDNGSYEFYNDGTAAKDLSQNNFKKFRSDIITAPVNVLPISFESFNIQQQNNTVLLNWSLGSATNISYFEVERSDGIKSFETIANMGVHSDNSYSYTDKSSSVTTIYYRIKAIDKSGVVYYSPIRYIEQKNTTESIKVYPNPFRDNILIHHISSPKDVKEIRVVNNKGQVMYSKSFHGDAATDYTIPAAQFVLGVYTLLIIYPDKTITGQLNCLNHN